MHWLVLPRSSRMGWNKSVFVARHQIVDRSRRSTSLIDGLLRAAETFDSNKMGWHADATPDRR
jgi:hypothetical protein